jgi:hypothetical protein
MLQITKQLMRFAAFTAALIVAPALNGQQSTQPVPAPVPAQIVSAHKVFISNAGTDAAAREAFKQADPEEAYDRFYSALQSWGKYELVSAPAEADLVFEIRFAAPLYSSSNLPYIHPEFELRILDAKTHFLLWSVTDPVDRNFRKNAWIKSFDQGLDALMNDVKKLSAPAVAADLSKK